MDTPLNPETDMNVDIESPREIGSNQYSVATESPADSEGAFQDTKKDGDLHSQPSETNAGVSVRELSIQLSNVEARILTVFEEKLAFDAAKEKQLDRLHEELQHYRSDIVFKATRPIFQSVIRLHDDIGKVLDALAKDDPAKISIERLLKLLSGFHDDVKLVLNNNGVGSFQAESEVFDPRRQRILRTVETTDASQVGRLAESLRPGFEYGDTLLEKERVSVYAMPSAKTVSKS